MADINSNAVWSETDSSNTSLSPFPGFPENQNPSTVNDAARSLMGAVKRWYNHANATATSGGSANAQTLTYTVAPGSLVAGDAFCFIAGASNSGSATLNINGLGAATIKYNGANLAGGEIASGRIVSLVYDGTNFQLISRSGTLSVANGGTGTTTSTGTGSVVLSNAPTFTGTLSTTGWSITQAGAGSFASDVNIGGVYQVGGVQIDASKLSNGTTGTGAVVLKNAPTFTGTVSTTGWSITQAGVGAFAGNVNIGGVYQVGGVQIAASNLSNGTTGTGAVVLAGSPTITGTLTAAAITMSGAGGSNFSTNLVLTNSSGGATNPTKFLRINPTGGLEIINNAITTVIFSVSDAGDLVITGTATKPGGGSWAASSDARLKTNLVTEFAALEKINKLKPTLFEWNNAEKHGSKQGEQVGGFIAQELLDVFPEFVLEHASEETDDGTEYTIQLPFKFYAYMVKAIQELSAKVDELNNKVS